MKDELQCCPLTLNLTSAFSHMMELLLSSYQFLFSFLIFLFMVLKIANQSSKTNNVPSNPPPRPWRLPLVGNMHQMIGSLPHHRLRILAKKYGPLMHLQLGELSTVVVSSAETAKEVLKDHDIVFANRPFYLGLSVISYDLKNLAFAPYGHYWRQLRKICALELLSAKRVQSFRSLREEEVSTLINSISAHDGTSVNLGEKISSTTYGITSRAAFGTISHDREEFISLAKEILHVTGTLHVSDLFPSVKVLPWISGLIRKLEKIHARTDQILQTIIDEHKTKKVARDNGDGEAEQDVVDVLLRTQENGDLECPFTDNHIKAVISDLFIGGIETSATTLEWAMSELLKNPRVMQKAQEEVRKVFNRKRCVDETDLDELLFLKSVIKETLRLHPPLPLLVPRESRERCQINGYEIPVKTQVIINAWAIGRDPEHWTDAESFNPERFEDSSITYKGANFEFIPFGAGRRICPGMNFGLANVELPLASLLYHFHWKLADGTQPEELDMSEAMGATVGRKRDLCVVPIPYHHSLAV